MFGEWSYNLVLTVIIFSPLLGVAWLALPPYRQDKSVRTAALLSSLFTLGLACYAYCWNAIVRRVVVASATGMPVSTTHTLVGAVLGVGMARGIAAINVGVVRGIFLSWVITVPAGALLAVVYFKALGLIL